MALTDNLIYALELNEASGNALDSHGSSPGTDINTVGSGTGLVYALARDFERDSSQSFSIADSAVVSVGDADCTWEAWVKLESLDAGFILAKAGATNGDYILEHTASGGGRFRLRVFGSAGYGDTGFILADTFGIPAISTWYHIVAWHDSVNNRLGISVNDVADVGAVGSHTAGIFDGTDALHVGSAVGFPSPWDGPISPVRFWKRVLSSAERTQLYNGGAGLAYSAFGGGGGVESEVQSLHRVEFGGWRRGLHSIEVGF